MVFDTPPSYDSATGVDSKLLPREQPDKRAPNPTPDADADSDGPGAVAAPQMHAGPSYATTTTALHHYMHPITGERITTMLPPDHPEMVCLQEGMHVNRTRFGLVGILAAVFFFPIGVGLCLLDRRVKCERCGRVVEDGVTCG